MKKFYLLLIGLVMLSCGSNENTTSNNESTESETNESNKGQAFIKDDDSKPTCLNIAIGSESHTTLVKAVQAAGVENALTNVGPITVFAPTDEAFAKVDSKTLEDLMKPENKEALANILKYHVTPGTIKLEYLESLKNLGQANNQKVAVEKKGDDYYIGTAKIVGTVEAGNGLVHVIDQVLLPPSE